MIEKLLSLKATNLPLTTLTLIACSAAILPTSLDRLAYGKPPTTLVFGRGGDSVGLDPASQTDGESFNVTDAIFDNLVTFKPGTTEVMPALATSWTISKNGLTYTFKLRDKVTFHNGTKFDASDVVYSFMRQLDAKHPGHKLGGPYIYTGAMGLDKIIASIKAVDPLTVQFTLAEPNAPFLSTLGMQAFAIICPEALEKLGKNYNQKPIGTGPFKFVGWEKNQKIVLRAFDDWWGGKQQIDTLIFRTIPDNNARVQEMMAGNLHVMDNPDTNHLDALEKRLGKKVKLVSQPGFNVGYLALNMDKKPFDNIKVRQAIAYAINKKGLIKGVYNGYGEAAKNPMPPTLWGYNDDIKDYDYSIQKAKQLMKEAGLEKGFTTTLWAMPVPRPYMPDGRKVAEALQGDLAKINIKAKIVSYDWGTYLEKTQNGAHDMALLGWTGDIGDPDNFLNVLLSTEAANKPARNISFYRNKESDSLLTAARRETDQEKRAELYKKAQAIIHQESPLIPLAHSVDIVPVQSSVKGFVLDPTGRRRFTGVSIEP